MPFLGNYYAPEPIQPRKETSLAEIIQKAVAMRRETEDYNQQREIGRMEMQQKIEEQKREQAKMKSLGEMWKVAKPTPLPMQAGIGSLAAGGMMPGLPDMTQYAGMPTESPGMSSEDMQRAAMGTMMQYGNSKEQMEAIKNLAPKQVGLSPEEWTRREEIKNQNKLALQGEITKRQEANKQLQMKMQDTRLSQQERLFYAGQAQQNNRLILSLQQAWLRMAANPANIQTIEGEGGMYSFNRADPGAGATPIMVGGDPSMMGSDDTGLFDSLTSMLGGEPETLQPKEGMQQLQKPSKAGSPYDKGLLAVKNKWTTGKVMKDMNAFKVSSDQVKGMAENIKSNLKAGKPIAVGQLVLLWKTIQGLDNSVVRPSELALFQSAGGMIESLSQMMTQTNSDPAKVRALSQAIVDQLVEVNQVSYKQAKKSFKALREQFVGEYAPMFKAAGVIDKDTDLVQELGGGYEDESGGDEAPASSATSAPTAQAIPAGAKRIKNPKTGETGYIDPVTGKVVVLGVR